MSENGLELLKDIFFSAGEGILIVNNQGRIILANHRASALFQYDMAELENMSVEGLVPPSFRKAHVSHREKYMEHPVARPMGVGLELVGLRKDGSTFPLEISLNDITHGEEKLVVTFITDITNRRVQEEALATSRKQLEKYTQDLEVKVKERTKELEHLNLGLKSQIRERKLAEAALQESLYEVKKAEGEILKALEKEKELNELKSRFISMASHEFRTPLTTVLSSANLIARYAEGSQQANREKHVDRIRNSVNDLTNILNDFLSLEKLESGAITMKLEVFSLPALLSEVKESMELLLKPGQQLMLHIANEISNVQSDPHILKNVLFNLISNASKYSEEKDKILVKADAGVHEGVSIQVMDEGIGIPESEQKNMFQRFFRAANATNIQGTGLGLNIVQRYVGLLGGEISFHSQEGKGSTFTVWLPVGI